MRFVILLSTITIIIGTIGAQTKPEPITIEIGNMKSKIPEAIGMAKALKSKSQSNDTESYADSYVRMASTLKTAGMSNLSDDDMKIILDVPEPTTSAMQLHMQRKNQSRLAIKEKHAEIDEHLARQAAARLEAEKLAEEQRQATVKQEQEQAKIDAMNRQAAAHEKLANEAAITNQLVNRLLHY